MHLDPACAEMTGFGLLTLLRSCSQTKNLARIHDVERIERALDRAHGVERRLRRVRPAGISSCPGRCRARRCRCRPWRARARSGARGRRGRASTSSSSFMSTRSPTWKLPSPTWPTIGASNLLSAMSRWVSVEAFGQPRDRHADVGRQRLGVGAQRRAAPNRRHGAPATAASGPRPWSPSRTGRRRIPWRSRRSACDCSATLAVAAVKFQEQHRRLRQRQLRIVIAWRAPAAHRAARCAPPGCRTGW